MPVSLANESRVVPPLDGAPGELVAAVAKPHPVAGALQLVRVLRLPQLETRRVHGEDVSQGVAELVHLGSVPPAPYEKEDATGEGKRAPPVASYLDWG